MEKAGTLKPQDRDPYYWNLVSQVYRGTGDIAASMRSFQEALKLAPADGELAAGHLWLLLDLDLREEVRPGDTLNRLMQGVIRGGSDSGLLDTTS